MAILTNSRARRQVVEAATVALVLVTLSYELHGMAEGCSFLEKASWIALELLRPMILAAWQSISAYLCGDSGFVRHAPQIVASIQPLLCVVGGLI
jgi:hypothetical protein